MSSASTSTPRKSDALMKGESYIKHIPAARIKKAVDTGKMAATDKFDRMGECDAVLIAVPTPLNKNREPDMSYIVDTCEAIAPHLRAGQLIVLESTTYPGHDRRSHGPDPGEERAEGGQGFLRGVLSRARRSRTVQTTPPKRFRRSSAATSPEGLAVADALYSAVIVRTVPVSSARAAEATKILENTFRAVNIALVNELKMAFMKMDIDVWEVIEAAKTKPFGFMPFYPGPGLGGHCIPIDPFYLTWKAREYGVATRFIELAGEVNTVDARFRRAARDGSTERAAASP